MNKTQTNYFRMYLSVQTVLNERSPIWSGIPRIAQYKNDFDGYIFRVSELREDAQPRVGVTEEKNRLKATIAVKVSTISGLILAYAFDSGKPDLAKKVKVAKSDIDRLKETEVDAFVKSIINLIKELIGELADFGVTSQQIEEIESLLNEFNVLIGKPRIILNKKYAAISSIEETMEKIGDLVKQKLDNMMLIFKESNPDFYEEYERARVIVDK